MEGKSPRPLFSAACCRIQQVVRSHALFCSEWRMQPSFIDLMLIWCCTVTIRLTPLGHDEAAENHRVITLNHDKKEVEIGRASKNAHKGLLASSDNAWFDYPILSRSHAKFIMSPSQKVSNPPPIDVLKSMVLIDGIGGLRTRLQLNPWNLLEQAEVGEGGGICCSRWGDHHVWPTCHQWSK